METPLKFHYPRQQPPPYIDKSSPPPPNHSHHQKLSQQRLQHGGSQLAMRHLNFQRISANRIIAIAPFNRSHLPQFFSVHSTTMSDQTKGRSQSVDASKSTLNIVDGKQEPEKSEPIPPPPEKPLPGDCCGSGCVRCVWDLYYEELEEYNNLYKSKSEAIVNPTPS